MKRLPCLVCVTGLTAALFAAPSPLDPAAVTEPRTFEGADGNILRYRWHEPSVAADATNRYPLVVLLHGSGERGTNNVDQLRWGARELLSYGLAHGDCFFIAGQVPSGKRWVDRSWNALDHRLPEEPSESMSLLIQLLERVREDPRVDRDRVYVTGVSMGGYGTWDLVSRRTDWFAAAMPVCGGGDVRQAWKLRKLPIWVHHGDRDTTVPFERSRRMVAALWAVDGDVKYTEYPGVYHASWVQAYGNKANVAWLFSRRRGEEKVDRVPFKDGDKVAFLGDSITQWGTEHKDGTPNPDGYVRLVVAAIRAGGAAIEPIFAGIAGNTSRDMLKRVETDVFAKQPNWLFLSCGVNDAPNGIDNPGVPLAEYRDNLAKIVRRAKQDGVRVIMLEPTMVLEEPHVANVNERAYVDAFRELAANSRLPLVPLNRAFTAAIGAKVDPKVREYTVDGTHMNKSGNRLMAETILETLGWGPLPPAAIE